MTKKRTIIIISVVSATLILGIVTLYVIKNINEKPPTVVKQDSNSATRSESTAEIPTIISFAMFRGVDDIHWGRGTAEVVRSQAEVKLRFKEDFEVAQGPDLFVYLSPNTAGQALGEFASLGNLKSNKGIQEYNLPENYKDYKTVVIWCRAFGVTFATAELK